MRNQVGLLAAALIGMLSGCGSESSSSGLSTVLCPEHTTQATYAYLLSQGDDRLTQFKVNSDGTLQALSPAYLQLPSGSFPKSMTFDCDRTHLYVSTSSEQKVHSFSISSNDGTLTEIGTAESAADSIDSIAYDGRSGIFAVSSSGNTITPFSILSGGELSHAGAVVTTGLDSPLHMAFLPEGKFGYAANTASNSVAQFSVTDSGLLSPLTPHTATTQGCPQSPVMTAQAKNGKSYVYILSCSNDLVEVFSVDSTGQLTSIQQAATTASPNNMYIGNGYLYTADVLGSSISMFSIGANGLLTPISAPLSLVNVPETIAVDQFGKKGYIVDFYNDVILYADVGSNGALTLTGGTIAINSGTNQILLK